MTTKTKRTFNLTEEALARVRELAQSGETARSQDGVIEVAVAALYHQVKDREEEALWARAAADPGFQGEASALANEFRDLESWPA